MIQTQLCTQLRRVISCIIITKNLYFYITVECGVTKLLPDTLHIHVECRSVTAHSDVCVSCEKVISQNTNWFHEPTKSEMKCSISVYLEHRTRAFTFSFSQTVFVTHDHWWTNTFQGQNVKRGNEAFHHAIFQPHVHSQLFFSHSIDLLSLFSRCTFQFVLPLILGLLLILFISVSLSVKSQTGVFTAHI